MVAPAFVDPAFDKLFPAACKAIGCDETDLLSVMISESGINPAAHNASGDASGLIQFMPDTLRGLGWTKGDQAFRMLAASAQLPYVVAYYRPWAASAGAWDSAGRLYQATFLPATLATSRAPEDVLAAKGGKLGWAYSANAVFDANGDSKITIQELTDATHRAAQANAKVWADMLERLGLEAPYVALLGLDSAADVQRALNELGTDPPLAEDGIIGPKSIAAIRAFQESAAIHVDGIAGPETRAALSKALTTAAATSK